MAREGKRHRALKEKIKVETKGNPVSLDNACRLAVETKSAKFDEGVDMAIVLGVDPRKADQNIRGSVSLPHGLGKTVRVAVFARGDKAKAAEEAGADIVGAEDLMEKVQGGFMDFDSVIASPDMMALVGRLGKVLGPRGLMPTPKTGTVTPDVAEAVRSVKAGRAEFRVEKAGIVHASIGKSSFSPDQLHDNAMALVNALNKQKPSTSKGVYLQSGYMSLTMGPSIAIDVAPLRG
jgi:large subunit ribosomal protein L1